MKTCICGNILSLQRQEDGIDNCPACDPPYIHQELDSLIDGIEYDMTGKIDCHDVMQRVLDLTRLIRENLV